jgi:hypothetical protein
LIFKQLQDLSKLGESVAQITQIEDSLAPWTEMAERADMLGKAVENLSLAQQINTLSSQGLNEENIRLILSTIDVTDEMIDEAIATGKASFAQTGAAGTTFSLSNAYKGLAASIGVSTAALTTFLGIIGGIAVVGVAVYAINDALTETKEEAKETLEETTKAFEQTKSEVQELQSELETTGKRIDELLVKEHLTLVESEELEKLKETNDELERELRIKEAIEKQQGKKSNDEAIDYFNVKVKDKTQYSFTPDGTSYEETDQVTAVENRIKSLAELEKQMKVLETEHLKYQSEHDGEQSDYYIRAIKNQQEKIDEARKFIDESIVNFQEQDDYLIEGIDKGMIGRLDNLYQLYDEVINGVTKSESKEINIDSILAKASFSDDAEKLIKLGKNGSLTPDMLKNTNGEFADLVEYLHNAGVEAEDLYQYIMAIADPNAINYDEIRNLFRESLGSQDGISNGYESGIWSQIEAAGLTSNEALKAYLVIKEKFGDHPDGWTVEDWIHNIQNELNSGLEVDLFGSFDGTEIGQRLQHATKLFNEGKISYKEYFDGLQTEIEKVDFSHYTDSVEDAQNAAAQLFVDSTQQTAQGLTNLINKFDSNEISVTEYLDGYLSIANTVSTLTDELQENSEAWYENGEGLKNYEDINLNKTQSDLESAIDTIENYQDSIYGLEQILSGKLELGTDEFTAQTNVIAEDLANIVASGGEMAEEIKNYMGTSADEIAQSLTDDVSNFDVAAQAIAANTNVAIQKMATSVGELFEELGNAISNFKVDLSFGISSITSQDVDMGILGTHKLPAITFSLEAKGDALTSVGSAISSFGKTLSENMTQYIESPDFTIEPEGDEYVPGDDVLNNYNNQLEKLKDTSGKAGKDAGEAYKEALEKELSDLDKIIGYIGGLFDDQIDAIEAAKDEAIDALEEARDKELEALEDQKSALEDYKDALEDANRQRELAISLQKAQYELERLQNQKTALVNYMPDTIVI